LYVFVQRLILDLLTKIQAKREAAARARRIAAALADDEDRKRVLAFAAQLDADADELERRMAAPGNQTKHDT
jgi:hypothetical protein